MTDVVYLEADPGPDATGAARLCPGPGAADGVFETIRIRQGAPTLWEAHLARLQTGLQRLGLQPPADFAPELAARVRDRVAALDDGVLRLVVSAESAPAGYRRRQPVRLLVSLQPRPAPQVRADHYERGVAVIVCEQRLAEQPALAGIKHLNRLEQILATRELDGQDCAEGLMLDTADRLVEGTRSNLFLRVAGGWWTPGLSRCGVRGILRDALLRELSSRGIRVDEADMPVAQLSTVEEMFLCNSVFGVWPVRAVAGRDLDVGADTRSAQQLADSLLCLV